MTKDYNQVFTWYQKGASLGDNYAEWAVAYAYEKGQGVTQSDDEALQWYEKAADNGSTDAMHRLVDAYQNGELSLKVDMDKAAYWFELAN
ncbi:MAG: sel1 repeat family protein [Pseudomonadota bacterium]|nr:sel1 repeat family protein [Pseudomonadota bacterium]